MVAIAAKSYWSNSWRDVQSLGIPALTFVFTQLIGGLPVLVYALVRWHSDDPFRYGHDVGEFPLYSGWHP